MERQHAAWEKHLSKNGAYAPQLSYRSSSATSETRSVQHPKSNMNIVNVQPTIHPSSQIESAVSHPVTLHISSSLSSHPNYSQSQPVLTATSSKNLPVNLAQDADVVQRSHSFNVSATHSQLQQQHIISHQKGI